MNFLDIAIEYHDAGLVVIPWWYDGSGKVKFFPWTEYQLGQSKDQVKDLFTKRPEYTGIAMVCTNGIEVIDIDVKADPKKTIAKEFFDDLFWRSGGDSLRQKCVIIRTKSNGWHVIYRAKNIEGNMKLATRKGMTEAMIETRGVGGLVFIAPSPKYKIEQGDYKNIQIVSDEERNILIETALSLDENPQPIQPVIPKVERKTKRNGEPKEGLSPGDDYNERTDLLGLLEDDGWKVSGKAPSGVLHLSKPGASNPRDTHATLIESNDGTPIFYPFTTGTQFEPRRCYNAFAVYTQLSHRGDYKASTKDLAAQGYGERMEKPEEKPKVDVSKLISFVRSTKFDNMAPIREESAILTLDIDGKTYKVGGRGQMGVITGEQKSGKSLVTSCIAASGLSGGNKVLNFSLQLDKGMEYYDTEQSSYFYQLTQKRLHELAGIRGNADRYAAYLLRRLSIKDRLAAIDEMLKGRKDLSCIIIDGAVDLCVDFNEVHASTEVADKLLQWSDQTGAMLITILHTTKSQGYLRGHLGTALQNKADFVIQAKQDKGAGVYTVECRESRFAPFPSFEFTRDQNGYPVLDDDDDRNEDDEPEPNQGIGNISPIRVEAETEIPF